MMLNAEDWTEVILLLQLELELLMSNISNVGEIAIGKSFFQVVYIA
jgi:hypothetical protein